MRIESGTVVGGGSIGGGAEVGAGSGAGAGGGSGTTTVGSATGDGGSGGSTGFSARADRLALAARFGDLELERRALFVVFWVFRGLLRLVTDTLEKSYAWCRLPVNPLYYAVVYCEIRSVDSYPLWRPTPSPRSRRSTGTARPHLRSRCARTGSQARAIGDSRSPSSRARQSPASRRGTSSARQSTRWGGRSTSRS